MLLLLLMLLQSPLLQVLLLLLLNLQLPLLLLLLLLLTLLLLKPLLLSKLLLLMKLLFELLLLLLRLLLRLLLKMVTICTASREWCVVAQAPRLRHVSSRIAKATNSGHRCSLRPRSSACGVCSESHDALLRCRRWSCRARRRRLRCCCRRRPCCRWAHAAEEGGCITICAGQVAANGPVEGGGRGDVVPMRGSRVIVLVVPARVAARAPDIIIRRHGRCCARQCEQRLHGRHRLGWWGIHGAR